VTEPVELENDVLRVVVLPARGGEIRELWHKPSSTQLLWHAPWADASVPTHTGSFDDWYAGGWQELLPNGDDACELDGVVHAFHGESWSRGWDAATVGDGVVLSVSLQTVPLAVERRMRLTGSTLVIEEKVRNVGGVPVRFSWGHHPAFGGNLLEEGCALDLPGGSVEGYHADLRTGRLAPLARSAWPHAVGRDGALVDLRRVPGPDAGSHDVTLVSDLPDGWFALRNPARDVGVACRFPRHVFRWLWLWQAYGGVLEPPFDAGTYTLAVEPWTSPPCLARAAARGAEARLEPGAALDVRVEVTVFQPAGCPLRRVLPGGKIDVQNPKEG
jgi:galactose mutarotase-like enzyme